MMGRVWHWALSHRMGTLMSRLFSPLAPLASQWQMIVSTAAPCLSVCLSAVCRSWPRRFLSRVAARALPVPSLPAWHRPQWGFGVGQIRGAWIWSQRGEGMATGSTTCMGTAKLTPSSCSVLGWERDTGCGIRVGRAALHPACLSFPIGSGRAVGTVGAEGRGIPCLQRGAIGTRGVGQEVGRRHEALPWAGYGIGSALVPCTAWTQRFPSVLFCSVWGRLCRTQGPPVPHRSIPQFPPRSQSFLVALLDPTMLLIPTPHRLPTQPPLMLPPPPHAPERTPRGCSQPPMWPCGIPWGPVLYRPSIPIGISPPLTQHPNEDQHP